MQTKVKVTPAQRFEIALQEAFELRSKNGRPLKHGSDWHRYADEVDYIPGFIRKTAERDPQGYYAWCAANRREATADEAEIIAGSADHKQGTLTNGEPAQSEVNLRMTLEVEGDDYAGEQFESFKDVAITMVKMLAACNKKTIHLLWSPNVACRELRGTSNLRAQFGGRFYASDRKDGENGSHLRIGTAHGGQTVRNARYAPFERSGY